MNCKEFGKFSLLGFFLFLLLVVNDAQATWWDANWPFRKEIKINSIFTVDDYQVLIYVSYSNGMKNDFSDLRFTYFNQSSNSEELIPYWIESKIDGVSAEIWVRVPKLIAGNTTVYLYYGNQQATSLSNGQNTFFVFDDFDDSSFNTTKWYADQTWTEANGYLSYTSSSSLSHIAGKDVNLTNYAIVSKYGLWASSSYGDTRISMRIKGYTESDRNNCEIYGFNRIGNSISSHCNYLYTECTNGIQNYTSSSTNCLPIQQYHRFELAGYENNFYLFVNKQLKVYLKPSTNYRTNGYGWNVYYSHTNGVEMRVDYTFTRNFVYPEPTYEIFESNQWLTNVSKPSPQVYDKNAVYGFQLSVGFDVDFVNFISNIEGFNNTYSYPVVQNSSSVFWINFTDIGAGNYSYYWHFGDQSFNISTPVESYQINKAVNTAGLNINGSLNQNLYLKYPNGVYAYGICYNANNIQPQLFRNSSYKGTLETTQLPLGNWTYQVLCDGNQNYTSDSISRWVFASKAPSIDVYQPNQTLYVFYPNSSRLIPVGWNISNLGLLPNSCFYDLDYISNASALCNNYYAFVNSSSNPVSRTYISGYTNFMTNSLVTASGSAGEKARVYLNYSKSHPFNVKDCVYYYNYAFSSGYAGIIINHYELNKNNEHYNVNGIFSFADPNCLYLNKNARYILISFTTSLTFMSYPLYVNYTQDVMHFYVPNSVGTKYLNVRSVESNTGNENSSIVAFNVNFINIFNVKNKNEQHLTGRIVFSNSTYNYTVQGTSPFYVSTIDLPHGSVVASYEFQNYVPYQKYFVFNSSTLIEDVTYLVNSGINIKVLDEQSRAPINWYKLAITNSSDRNEVNFDSMTSGSYTNYLTVGKGYPSTSFRNFLDDDINTFSLNPVENFTYNFGYTNATFEIVYDSSTGGTIIIKIWNNVFGKWDVAFNKTVSTTSKTRDFFNVNNKPIPELNITTGYYGDLFQNCLGYYCPLFEISVINGNAKIYEIRMIQPYSYDINGFLSINFTDFGMSTGRSRITINSPLFSASNNYGERTYYVDPTTSLITSLNAYLYPACTIQQFNVWEQQGVSDVPKEIKGAMVSIYKEFEGKIYAVDQELTSDLGTAFLCVDPSNSYIFTVVHPDYEPFTSYSISFSNPSQPVNVYLPFLSFSKKIFPKYLLSSRCLWSDNLNSYDENQTFSQFKKHCPDVLPENATSFTYYCYAQLTQGNAKYASIKPLYFGLNVWRKQLSSGFPPSNISLPLWNESSLPYDFNYTSDYVLIYNATSIDNPSMFSYQSSDEGEYLFRCYLVYDVNITTGFDSKYMTSVAYSDSKIVFRKGLTIAPAGKGLISLMMSGTFWFIALLFSMMVTGFFGYRFGVNSMLIFFLMWGLFLTIFGGWGLNFPTGILILAILIWIALTIGRW